MLPEVTQENVHLFLPYKAAKISSSMRKHSKLGIKEALLNFYHSRAYRLLEREETKLWHNSPEQIYAEYLRPATSTKRHYQNGPHHSKLLPYAAHIQGWRNQGMTMRGIAAELAKYGCVTTAQNICRFLKKNKRRKNK
ncbi:hypothetical protein SDC9_102904 [bioreactor metagenome]|uniref:Uncharacterized protein n=1 Tax=bioreactor metagenome TaxID=1076179 RepID=A0A645AS52_9ZZZZ